MISVRPDDFPRQYHNRLFSMPVLMLFRYGDLLSVAIIDRRLSKRDQAKDVLEKVTLIKDIAVADPLRAHVEILHDLSLPALHDEFEFHNFVGLHQAWQKRLSSYALNQRFYREVADWYFWALTSPGVTLPRAIEAITDAEEREKQRSIFFIRLLTRLIFCWFLQEKRLVPRDLFRPRVAKELLEDFSPKSGSYYRAFLQNLFFATLNQDQDKREWRRRYKAPRARDGNRGVTNLWRYQDLLTDPQRLESLLRDQIPFVNGGLFDCLDDVRDDRQQPNVRLDDFSEEQGNTLCLPNELFFGEEREVDLSEVYDDKRRKHERVRGIVEILSRYKFTVEENTPLEEEIALDPELLGKVFENLLASYNEDTRTTARKALGAFYTPREIVRYMVDQSLRSYLSVQVPAISATALDDLFTADVAHYPTGKPLSADDKSALVGAIGRVKILDPACGSGAFPMGALHRLVDLLQKLDPNNENWKRDRLAEAEQYREVLRSGNASAEELAECDAGIDDIRHSFDSRFHALDFARKLYLIENCIYGVDIQPIACQIAKLRFFIALIVDQRVDPRAPNLGVRPLPNLETKIVAADSLVPIDRPQRQLDLLHARTKPLRRQLEQVRHQHFNARTLQRKSRCRERDAALRTQVAKLLEDSGMPTESAHALAAWDPYDQNHAAGFFDPDWMFGLTVGKVRTEGAGPATLRGNFTFVNQLAGQKELVEGAEQDSGFDIVIGNPPYVRIQTLKQKDPKLVAFYKDRYKSAKKGNYDLYVVFVEAGLNFLKADGHLAYILPHKFFNAQYGAPLRELLAKGRHLQHVVHFGDQQVFPGATNYVCLLFLAKGGAKACRFVRADDIEAWLKTFRGAEGKFSAASMGASEWNFAVGRDASVFVKLDSFPKRFGDVASRISQGIRTSANEVYVLDALSDNEQVLRAYSKQLDREVSIESGAVCRFLQGREIKRFSIRPSGKVVLIPYRRADNGAHLIPLREIERSAPKLHAYLLSNRRVLEQRENGRMRGPEWYGYVYPKNIDVMYTPKLVVPDIADRASFALDENGRYAFTSGYGITLKEDADVSLKFLLGLANSCVLEFFWRKVSTPLRGGFFRYFTQFIEKLPIANADDEQELLVERLADYLMWLNAHCSDEGSNVPPRDALMLGYFEQVLNGLVYELYFPDELHERGLQLFNLVEQAGLPELDSIPKSNRLSRLREVFETICDADHPLRGALPTLGSLETVRIIEGGK